MAPDLGRTVLLELPGRTQIRFDNAQEAIDYCKIVQHHLNEAHTLRPTTGPATGPATGPITDPITGPNNRVAESTTYPSQGEPDRVTPTALLDHAVPQPEKLREFHLSPTPTSDRQSGVSATQA